MESEQSKNSKEMDDINRAFSELSSYHSGTSLVSSDLSSGDTGTSGDGSSSEEGSTVDEDDFTTDDSDFAEFVRLRPEDRRWIDAAWTYFDREPVYRRQLKPVKVVRKMRAKISSKASWTELQHEYNLRHPLCTDGKTIEELRKLSLDARYMPLPDLTV
ncbi:unnamed protein product [Strongylus vulgaris]|uniref:Uncharacterized protein n=1 Tax=Strongylus vulgaris TaxID=40348 RepID=A0A3P7LTZ5_STRVU|nr:unnamed protein product [Strongylus vulgaris]